MAGGMALTTHPHLNSTAICLLPHWAFMACTRVNFNFTFISELLDIASYNIMNKI